MPPSACRRFRGATCASCRPSRSTRRPRATSTTRSPPSGSTAAASACGSTSPTWRRMCGPARTSTARRSSARPPSTAGGADAAGGALQPGCSLVPDQDRLAVTVELDFESAKLRRIPPLGNSLRQAAQLPGRQRSSPARRAPSRRGRSRWPPPAGRWPPPAEARKGALAVESSEPRLLREGPTRQVAAEQTESHRVIEHLMVAANEAVATLPETQLSGALPRARAAGAGAGRAAGRAAGVAGRPDAADPQAMTPQQAADAVAGIAHLVAEEVRRRGHGGAALTCCVRSNRRTTRRATSVTPGCARCATATSPRGSGATPTSSATAPLLNAIGAGEDLPLRHGSTPPPSGARSASATRRGSSVTPTPWRAPARG